MSGEFQVTGTNDAAPFSLKLHRGDGMVLLAMDWKNGKPPVNFVGFAIQYKEPRGTELFALKNRLTFPVAKKSQDPNRFSTLRSPIQKFRWVHFPRNAHLDGEFIYRVTPVFMNEKDELSLGDFQEANLELRRETYPDQLNVAYTRGFVSSQAFVEKFKTVSKLLPSKTAGSLDFKPTATNAAKALPWMGFEGRAAILGVLDKAIEDESAEVRVVAYDLNQPEIVSRLEKLGSRLKVIIDNEGTHGEKKSNENEAETKLKKSAGSGNVKRQCMGKLQHNKFIAVNGKIQLAVCGSTNFSWRAFYVQSNNAVVFQGKPTVDLFLEAFENYWKFDTPADFGKTASAGWQNVGLSGIEAKIAFSPHSSANALLQSIADDISTSTSSLLYSLAFLYQTQGPIKDSIKKITKTKDRFVYGISDRKVGGITLQKPTGNLAVLYPSALAGKNIPEPFKSEPKGGGGIRMHHKFVVIDFNKPTGRVYLGSYNFSAPADLQNGENLLLIKDRRIAVSYVVEALSMFDHYHFRVTQQEAKKKKKKLELQKPPRKAGEKPWWSEYYTDPHKIHDRQLFA